MALPAAFSSPLARAKSPARSFEATRLIREAENGRHLPIIAVTALTGPGDRARCLAAGMDDYLSKPLRMEALNEAFKRWLPTDQERPAAVLARNEAAG